MNNEEKILRVLEQMNERQNRTETILEQMQGDISELKEGQAKLNQNVAKIEVEHGKTLGALLDGHQVLTRQLGELKETVDEMAPTVVALDVLHQMREHK